MENNLISIEPKELKMSVDSYLQTDPEAKKIADTEIALRTKQLEIIELESQLLILQKQRPKVNIPYRDSIKWCLSVDATNPYYFLKSKEGLVKCVQFKHKIKLDTNQKNALGSVLSMMYKEGKIGRIEHTDVYFYGLPEMFEKDENGQLTILKNEYKQYVFQLKQVNV